MSYMVHNNRYISKHIPTSADFPAQTHAWQKNTTSHPHAHTWIYICIHTNHVWYVIKFIYTNTYSHMLTFQRSHRHRKKHHFKAPLFCVFFIHDYISMRVLRSCKNLLFMSHGKRDFVHPLCHPLFVSLHMSHDKPHVVHFRSHGKRDMAHQFTTRGGGRGETQSPFLSLFSQVTVNEISCVIFAKEKKEKKLISSKEVTAKRT